MAIAIALFLTGLTGFALYSIYAVHHLNEYGYSGAASQQILRIYLGSAAVIIIVTVAGLLFGVLTR